MKAYKRARGLYDKCAETWKHGHKCAATGQLHVMQEMLDLLIVEDPGGQSSDVVEETAYQVYLAISTEAFTGRKTTKTLQLIGSIQGKPILILVDSSSSRTFISVTAALGLQGVSCTGTQMQVQVANREKLNCAQELKHAKWQVQGHLFHSDLKVLPLPCYHMVFGMDWLAAYSPMRVD